MLLTCTELLKRCSPQLDGSVLIHWQEQSADSHHSQEQDYMRPCRSERWQPGERGEVGPTV